MVLRLSTKIPGAAFITACCTAILAYGSDAAAESGIASIYAYSGSKTASGERASPGGLTAAHRTLPFGTQVRVTNKRNGHSVVVRINDRGPFVRGRVIDVTPAAARALGFSGLAPVTLESSSRVARSGTGASSFARDGRTASFASLNADPARVLAKD
jgi:rare lipoprotein A